MCTRCILYSLLLFPIYTFAAGVLPIIGAAGVGAAVGGLGVAASMNRGSNSAVEQPKYDSTNAPEAHANPQNTTSASFQPNYHNQTSPTININVKPIMPLNFGDHSSTNFGTETLDGEQNGSDLNSRTDSSSSNNANPTQNSRTPRQPWRRDRSWDGQLGGQSMFGKKAVGIAGLATVGLGVVYYALKTNNDELLNSPHAWHNWKRGELSTVELGALAPEQVGEMMAYDAAFAMKRSISKESSIPGIIEAIDQELQQLKSSLTKTTWAQRLYLSWLCGMNEEHIVATKKAIERDEILVTQLSKWYANDLSLNACGNRAEFRS